MAIETRKFTDQFSEIPTISSVDRVLIEDRSDGKVYYAQVQNLTGGDGSSLTPVTWKVTTDGGTLNLSDSQIGSIISVELDGDLVVNLPEVDSGNTGGVIRIYVRSVSGSYTVTINAFGGQDIKTEDPVVLRYAGEGVELVSQPFDSPYFWHYNKVSGNDIVTGTLLAEDRIQLGANLFEINENATYLTFYKRDGAFNRVIGYMNYLSSQGQVGADVLLAEQESRIGYNKYRWRYVSGSPDNLVLEYYDGASWIELIEITDDAITISATGDTTVNYDLTVGKELVLSQGTEFTVNLGSKSTLADDVGLTLFSLVGQITGSEIPTTQSVTTFGQYWVQAGDYSISTIAVTLGAATTVVDHTIQVWENGASGSTAGANGTKIYEETIAHADLVISTSGLNVFFDLSDVVTLTDEKQYSVIISKASGTFNVTYSTTEIISTGYAIFDGTVQTPAETATTDGYDLYLEVFYRPAKIVVDNDNITVTGAVDMQGYQITNVDLPGFSATDELVRISDETTGYPLDNAIFQLRSSDSSAITLIIPENKLLLGDSNNEASSVDSSEEMYTSTGTILLNESNWTNNELLGSALSTAPDRFGQRTNGVTDMGVEFTATYWPDGYWHRKYTDPVIKAGLTKSDTVISELTSSSGWDSDRQKNCSHGDVGMKYKYGEYYYECVSRGASGTDHIWERELKFDLTEEAPLIPTGLCTSYPINTPPDGFIKADGTLVNNNEYLDLLLLVSGTTDFTESTGTACTFDETGHSSGLDHVVIAAGHGLSNGDAIYLKGAGLPGGLTDEEVVYVIDADTDYFRVADSVGGTAKSFTGDGTAGTTFHTQFGFTFTSPSGLYSIIKD